MLAIRPTLALPLLLTVASPAAETTPTEVRRALEGSCFACHTGDNPQAEVNLDREIDWQASETVAVWRRALREIESGRMPPGEDPSLSPADRTTLESWFFSRLTEHSGIGGGVPRRLNRVEYENSIRDLFGLPDFQLPDSFPADDSAAGFDNVGEGLIFSPPLMAQYLELATAVADEILPADVGPLVVEPKRYAVGVSGLATRQGAGLMADRFRLVSSRNMASAAAWPARFQASESGVYRLKVKASPFQTEKMFYKRRSAPFRLVIYARRPDQPYVPFGDLRKLADFEVSPAGEAPSELVAEIELFKGEIFGMRWQNGPAYSDPPKRDYSPAFLAHRLKHDRLYYAAMLQIQGGERGTTQAQLYEQTKALMESGPLDLDDSRLDKMPEDWGGGLGDKPHNWISRFVEQELFRVGPALDITGLEIEGPLRRVEDDETRKRKARTARFLSAAPANAPRRKRAEAVLRSFLPRAFRRPVGEERLGAYLDLAMQQERLEDGLHLAVRRALVSPVFLYRAVNPGPMDDFDLAARLSYFLSAAPPDDQLAEAARSANLSNRLRQETLRLLGNPRRQAFVRSFTGQWLDTSLLTDIMPDPRLLKYYDPDRQAMIDEVEMFFAEMIRENLPLESFVDPDFSYRSARLNKIYGGDLEGNQMRRVTLERGGRHGGLLGFGAVLMATANGVDTHPVQRGVWLLENVLGMTPPPPPEGVPAIAPDTSGAGSIRDQLDRHRADPSCARCHDSIDPLGMVMENFDPVGRWRDHYPVFTKPPDGSEALTQEFYSAEGRAYADGPPIDAAGSMPDGTELRDVTDFKRYVLSHMDLFTRCLTEKLLIYATGRPLSFGDEQVVDGIVADIRANDGGFRDLILAVVESESFSVQ